MSTPQDVIAAALLGTLMNPVDAVARRSLDALTAAGYAVVKLPEPIVDEWGETSFPVPLKNDRQGRVRIEDDGRIMPLGVPSPLRSTEDALSLATALIAAAQAVAR